MFVGVDVGGTQIKYGLFEKNGNPVCKWISDTDVSDSGKNIIPDIAASVKEKLNEQSYPYDRLLGVGIGVPGAVRKDGSVNRCVNLGWGDVDVKGLMSEALLGKPVAVINDANAAALGEQWMGAAKGYSNVVLITLGTGIGGGVIVNDEIVIGAYSGGGEIGHITVEPVGGRECTCGKRGCIEQYASATGFVKSMKEYLARETTETPLRNLDNITAKDIFDYAKSGDKAALGVVEENCRLIGLALSSVSCTIDPEVFVIGGGVSKAGEIIPKTIKKYYRQYAFHTSVDTPVILATLGNDAGIYGAARAIIKEVTA